MTHLLFHTHMQEASFHTRMHTCTRWCSLMHFHACVQDWMEVWTERLREWFSGKVLQPLVAAVQVRC